MEASVLVIKVRYGDVLRRFSAKFVDAELDLSMRGLIEKIFSLFNFSADASIMLTYIDEDGDSVALFDDDDLSDVAKQSLNPLRITVKLNAEKTGALSPPTWVKKQHLIPLEQFRKEKNGALPPPMWAQKRHLIWLEQLRKENTGALPPPMWVKKQHLIPLEQFRKEKNGALPPNPPLTPLEQIRKQKTGALPPNPPLIPLEQIREKKTGPPIETDTFITWNDSSRAKLLFQCPNHEVSEILETAPPFLREKLMKLWPESEDRDWSEVDTVVKILSSDQKMIDYSDMVPPGSSPYTEIGSRRWLIYVLDGRKEESFENSFGERDFEETRGAED